MKTETDNIVPVKVKFGEFISIVTALLHFRKGFKMSFDQWDHEYKEFRVAMSAYFPEFVAESDPVDLVTEWANNEYFDYRMDSHDYCLKTNRKPLDVTSDRW